MSAMAVSKAPYAVEPRSLLVHFERGVPSDLIVLGFRLWVSKLHMSGACDCVSGSVAPEDWETPGSAEEPAAVRSK